MAKKFKLTKYLLLSGYEHALHVKIQKFLFQFCVAVNLIISFYLMYLFSTTQEKNPVYLIVLLGTLWTIAFFFVLFVIWLGFLAYLDYRIFQRKLNIEDVLPDFLRLTAANIRVGLTIDKALFQAVRPKFGTLAKEVEVVAKEIVSGTSLESALKHLAERYQSKTLQHTVILLTEGINSGGDIGTILDNIANQITESRLLKQQMEAQVASYAIFINFAALVAAPGLLALSNQLLGVIKFVIGKVPNVASPTTILRFSQEAISLTDFYIFSIIIVVSTSLFSAMLVSIIKYGTIRQGLQRIPINVIAALAVFILSNLILSKFLSGLIF